MAGINIDQEVLHHVGGEKPHNLNHILQNDVDSPEEISLRYHSPYIESSNLVAYLENHTHNFSVLSLNVQSVASKIDKVRPIIEDLANNKIEFSALCFQETWLKESDLSNELYHIPNYTPISLNATCSSHGGLTIYLHNSFQYSILNMYTPSRL